jgi:hypothetical protein
MNNKTLNITFVDTAVFTMICGIALALIGGLMAYVDGAPIFWAIMAGIGYSVVSTFVVLVLVVALIACLIAAGCKTLKEEKDTIIDAFWKEV